MPSTSKRPSSSTLPRTFLILSAPLSASARPMGEDEDRRLSRLEILCTKDRLGMVLGTPVYAT